MRVIRRLFDYVHEEQCLISELCFLNVPNLYTVFQRKKLMAIEISCLNYGKHLYNIKIWLFRKNFCAFSTRYNIYGLYIFK